MIDHLFNKFTKSIQLSIDVGMHVLGIFLTSQCFWMNVGVNHLKHLVDLGVGASLGSWSFLNTGITGTAKEE